jgi:hypothetical protein
MTEQQGGCQCGRVRYRITTNPLFLVACHCTECQRQSGSAFGLSLIVPQDGIAIEGELKMFERSSDSGRLLKCYFCPECGTRIYHQPSYAPVANVRAGTLDDTSGLEPKMHAWVSSKQPWVAIPEGVPAHAKQP